MLHHSYARRRRPRLVRISKLKFLSDLIAGKLRFNPTSTYVDTQLRDAQRDDEICRKTFIPGSFFSISSGETSNGRPIGDVELSWSRTSTKCGRTEPLPYWLLCFSTELDPRLFSEFCGDTSDEHGYLILFNIEHFHRRIAEAIDPLGLICGRVEVDYYDEYFPPNWGKQLPPVIGTKPFRFAYQRETRFFLLPEAGKTTPLDSPLQFQSEKLDDIAGVYDAKGHKVSGYGPVKLFSNES